MLSSSFFIPISPRPGSDPWVLQQMGEDRFSPTGSEDGTERAGRGGKVFGYVCAVEGGGVEG